MSIHLVGTILDVIDKLISRAENEEFRQELKDLREQVRGDLSGQAGLLFGDDGKVFQSGEPGATSRFGDALQRNFPGFDQTKAGNNGLIDEAQSFRNVLELRNLGLEDINALDQSFQARQDQGLARLAGRGEQERRDLRRDFDSELGNEQAALQNRGGGGFLASSLRLQNARARQEGLNRLNAQLTDFDFAAFTRLSGDTLNAQAAGNQQRLSLEAEPLNARIRHGDKLANFDLGVPLVPPGPTPFAGLRDSAFNLQAMNTAADAAEAGSGGPGAGQKVAQGLGGGGGGVAAGIALAPVTGGISVPLTVGLGLAGAGGSASGCLHGDSILETAYGPTQISTVEVGEAILCEDDEFHRIIAIDSGDIPDTPQREKYVKIVAGFNELILTVKHPVGGKPAGQWEPGEHIECFGKDCIVLVEPHDYVSGHDIMVEGDVDYVANGFVVSSVIGKIVAEIGMDKWNELRAQTVGV